MTRCATNRFSANAIACQSGYACEDIGATGNGSTMTRRRFRIDQRCQTNKLICYLDAGTYKFLRVGNGGLTVLVYRSGFRPSFFEPTRMASTSRLRCSFSYFITQPPERRPRVLDYCTHRRGSSAVVGEHAVHQSMDAIDFEPLAVLCGFHRFI